jgi:hypothetical protein
VVPRHESSARSTLRTPVTRPIDVWTSQKAFDKFAKTLMPILHQIRLDPGQPQVMDMHKVIVPARKAAAAKKPKKTTAKRKKR